MGGGLEWTQKGSGRKVTLKVQTILEQKDGVAALVALKKARTLAMDGNVIPLLDLLAPEGSRTATVTDSRTGKTRTIRQ